MLVAGVDIVEIVRIKKVMERYGDKFIKRIYTKREVSYCRGRPAQFARRFAGKEAVMKALGTGIRGVRWRDIEIVRSEGVAPVVILHGTALARSRKLGIKHLALSLTDSKEYAVASAVAESHNVSSVSYMEDDL